MESSSHLNQHLVTVFTTKVETLNKHTTHAMKFMIDMDVEPKIGVVIYPPPPKMDGENFMENPMNKWDDLGGFPIIFWKHPYWLMIEILEMFSISW